MIKVYTILCLLELSRLFNVGYLKVHRDRVRSLTLPIKGDEFKQLLSTIPDMDCKDQDLILVTLKTSYPCPDENGFVRLELFDAYENPNSMLIERFEAITELGFNVLNPNFTNHGITLDHPCNPDIEKYWCEFFDETSDNTLNACGRLLCRGFGLLEDLTETKFELEKNVEPRIQLEIQRQEAAAGSSVFAWRVVLMLLSSRFKESYAELRKSEAVNDALKSLKLQVWGILECRHKKNDPVFQVIPDKLWRVIDAFESSSEKDFKLILYWVGRYYYKGLFSQEGKFIPGNVYRDLETIVLHCGRKFAASLAYEIGRLIPQREACKFALNPDFRFPLPDTPEQSGCVGFNVGGLPIRSEEMPQIGVVVNKVEISSPADQGQFAPTSFPVTNEGLAVSEGGVVSQSDFSSPNESTPRPDGTFVLASSSPVEKTDEGMSSPSACIDLQSGKDIDNKNSEKSLISGIGEVETFGVSQKVDILSGRCDIEPEDQPKIQASRKRSVAKVMVQPNDANQGNSSSDAIDQLGETQPKQHSSVSRKRRTKKSDLQGNLLLGDTSDLLKK